MGATYLPGGAKPIDGTVAVVGDVHGRRLPKFAGHMAITYAAVTGAPLRVTSVNVKLPGGTFE
jgi:hypothetical protein